jgi:hypothetical protein
MNLLCGCAAFPCRYMWLPNKLEDKSHWNTKG